VEATGACASTVSTAGAVLHGGRVGRVGQERVHRAGVVDPGSLLPPTRRRRAVAGATSTLGRNTGPAQKRTYRPAPRPATPLHLSIEAPSRSGPNPETVGPPAPAGPLTASPGAVVVRRQYGLRCTLRLFSAKDGDPGPLARGKAQSLGYRGERRARPATNQPCVEPRGPQQRSPVPLGPSMGTEWRGRVPMCITQGCPLVPPHVALRVADRVESRPGRSGGGGGGGVRASTPAGPNGAEIFYDWNPS